jgi:uncharacterized protein
MIITAYNINFMKKNKKGLMPVNFGKNIVNFYFESKDAFIDGIKIEEKYLNKIEKNKEKAFLIEDGKVYKIQLFDEKTNKFYKLRPTSIDTAPTMEISGIPMHITVEMNPMEDTLNKIKGIEPVCGICLDTCLGLGYSAAELAKRAKKVIAFEISECAFEMIKINPWSEIMDMNNVDLRIENVVEGIKSFSDEYFDVIIHDPPSYKFAVELYLEDFYLDLYRVMKKGARLYHYVGEPGKKNQGLDIPTKVKDRLIKIGFKNVEFYHRGVIGIK